VTNLTANWPEAPKSISKTLVGPNRSLTVQIRTYGATAEHSTADVERPAQPLSEPTWCAIGGGDTRFCARHRINIGPTRRRTGYTLTSSSTRISSASSFYQRRSTRQRPWERSILVTGRKVRPAGAGSVRYPTPRERAGGSYTGRGGTGVVLAGTEKLAGVGTPHGHGLEKN